MKRLFILPILLLFVGCGSNLGAEARARSECPTLTDTDFDYLWIVAVGFRDSGFTKEQRLSDIATWACVGNPTFDRDSECRVCLRAITEGVY